MIQRLLKLDADLSARIRVAERPGFWRSAAAFLAHSGDSWFWLLGLLLLAWLGNPSWKYKALVLGVAILISAVLVMVIKFTIRRRRPEGEWGAMYRNTDPHSFPSGHAARACLLAVLSLGLGPAWFGILLAVWAPLVCLARVAMGVHYLSDIIAGMILGSVLGGLVLQIL